MSQRGTVIIFPRAAAQFAQLGGAATRPGISRGSGDGDEENLDAPEPFTLKHNITGFIDRCLGETSQVCAGLCWHTRTLFSVLPLARAAQHCCTQHSPVARAGNDQCVPGLRRRPAPLAP